MKAVPDPDLIYDLFAGIFRPQFVWIALRLDVFTAIAANPATLEQAAKACHCSPAGLRPLLDYLCALRLLECHHGLYGLTAAAETFLVRGRKAYAGDLILNYSDPAMYESILNSIRTGQPRSLGENFVQDAWLESYSQTRLPGSLEMWRAAGIRAEDPGLSLTKEKRALRILDIACGCAIKSFALAQTAPDIHVTCLDSADVLAVARDLAGRMGLTSRVAFVPADLLTADFGASLFDLVLVGQISHYLTSTQNCDLFRRLHAALRQTGLLVIDCPMASSAPDEAAGFLTLFLWANSGGAAHSFETYKSWLEASGFEAVTQRSQRWLTARRA